MIPFLEKSASLMSFRRNRSRFFCFFISLFFPAFSLFPQLKEVHSFDKEWLVYESNWKTFLPYISNKHFSYHAKSVLVDVAAYPQAHLKIEPNTSCHFFLNGTYQYALESNSFYLYSLDSLKRKYPRTSNLVITLYKDDLSGLPGQMSIVRKWPIASQSKVSQLDWTERFSTPQSNFIGISILLILLLLALFHEIYPKYFYAYFQFSDWIHWREKDNVIQNTPFAFPNVFILFIISLLSAFIGFFNMMNESVQVSAQGESLGLGFSIKFLSVKTFLAFGLYVSRYFMYQIFATLFKIEFLAKPHFYRTIQTNIQFISLLYLGLILSSLYVGPLFQPNLPWLKSIVYAYFFIRFIYFFQIFRLRFSMNVFTLAAYLIIIEGQVVLFGINQILFPQMNE
jgi:hypothetical protein